MIHIKKLMIQNKQKANSATLKVPTLFFFPLGRARHDDQKIAKAMTQKLFVYLDSFVNLSLIEFFSRRVAQSSCH